MYFQNENNKSHTQKIFNISQKYEKKVYLLVC